MKESLKKRKAIIGIVHTRSRTRARRYRHTRHKRFYTAIPVYNTSSS